MQSLQHAHSNTINNDHKGLIISPSSAQRFSIGHRELTKPLDISEGYGREEPMQGGINSIGAIDEDTVSQVAESPVERT